MWDIYIVKITVTPPAGTSESPDISNSTVTLSDPILIHSDTNPLPEYKVLTPKLKLGDNSSGSLEFTLPPNNVGYNQINCMSTEVIVNKDDQEYWRGRLLSINEDFWKCKKCVFEGELSYLLDSIQLPSIYAEFNVGGGVDIDVPHFFYNWLQSVLGKHNAATEPYKHFLVGDYPSDVDFDENLNGRDELQVSTNYDNTLDVLRNSVFDKLDIHASIRHHEGIRYIDFLPDYNTNNTQTINFGENLLDYVSDIDGNDFCTVIYPRGKRIEREKNEKNAMYTRTGDPVVCDTHTYYEKTTQDGMRVYRSITPEEGVNPHKKNYYERRDFFRSLDRMVVIGKKYYTRSVTKDYAYDAVENPTGNPKSKGYYEKNGSSYVLTSDTTVQSDKTYYVRIQETTIKFSKVTPVAGQDPKTLKWYEEDITSQYFDEYTTIIGTQTGYYDNNTLYIDGQAGKIYSKPGIKKVGYIYGVIDFDDVDTPSKLAKKARQFLKKIKYDELTITITALDLHYLNPSIQSLNLLDKVLCISEPHGLNDDPNNLIYFPVTDIEIDLLNPENTKYTLCGKGKKGISNSTSSDSKNFSKYMTDNKVVNQSVILEAAKSQADDIIKKSINGSYASFIYTQNTTPSGVVDTMTYVDPDNPDLGYRATGIRVANKPTDEEATDKWVWYSGGLGHYHRASTSAAWGSPNLALTMDGAIVANRITTGTLNIGTSTVASHPTSVAIKIYNGSTQIGSWGSGGISILKGSMNINGNFIVDTNGNLTAQGSAKFKGSIQSGSTISGSTISGSTITGSTLRTKTSGATGKQVVIASDHIEVYNTSNSSSGYLRLFQGNAVGNFHQSEFGIASNMCHVAYDNGSTYEEVEPKYIIQVAKYFKKEGGWANR